MKVARWGNSLAVRLPRPVVEALELREGDEVEITAPQKGTLEVSRDKRREEAIARIRATRWQLPPDYKFDREEANARDGRKDDRDAASDT